MKTVIFIFTIILIFSGCSTRKKSEPSYKPQEKNRITQALYEEFKKWENTPYKYGGNSFSGIDCSGFTRVVYKNVFHKNIPRTTREQATIGKRVSRSDLRVGDIVLFKTGKNVRHSGIIIEGNRFIHSGTSTGVIVSSLDNPYWKSHYWQIRRVL